MTSVNAERSSRRSHCSTIEPPVARDAACHLLLPDRSRSRLQSRHDPPTDCRVEREHALPVPDCRVEVLLDDVVVVELGLKIDDQAGLPTEPKLERRVAHLPGLGLDDVSQILDQALR